MKLETGLRLDFLFKKVCPILLTAYFMYFPVLVPPSFQAKLLLLIVGFYSIRPILIVVNEDQYESSVSKLAFPPIYIQHNQCQCRRLPLIVRDELCGNY